MEQHPNPALRNALTDPLIEPTPPGDPQPNPDDSQTNIAVQDTAFTLQAELSWIVQHVGAWLPEHPEKTVAVLVPSNKAGADLAGMLAKVPVPYSEMLRSTPETRRTIGALTYILRHLEKPLASPLLAKVYQVWHRNDPEETFPSAWIDQGFKAIKGLKEPERFIWPVPGEDPISSFPPDLKREQNLVDDLDQFRHQIQRWQMAAMLPIDQLILTIAQDLFQKPAELALSHKLAATLANTISMHSEWRLPDFIREFESIAKNERNFLGFSEDDTGFDPDSQKGKVLITTYHKAKGLEWDRVYLTDVSNYSFPSALPEDPYHSDRWFLQAHLDLTAEAVDQLASLFDTSPYSGHSLGAASEESREDIAREGLRRLFVGITRARSELFLSYNTGFRGTNQPALALAALKAYLEGNQHEPA